MLDKRMILVLYSAPSYPCNVMSEFTFLNQNVLMQKNCVLNVCCLGIRDYIHVMDLADGHVAALTKLEREHLRIKMYNLGTGTGVSVLQLIKTFEKTNNVSVPFTIEPRRLGDISTMYADP